MNQENLAIISNEKTQNINNKVFCDNIDMKSSNHRKKHGDRFIKYLKKNLNKNITNLKILEIGCGDAYILNKLKKICRYYIETWLVKMFLKNKQDKICQRE